MGKKTKFGKNRLDKFYHLAKEQGYRSRAAFKLIQLNKKYEFLGKARACLDLCAAPGGWLQVARKYMPVQSLIVGVDLAPIRAIPNVITMQEDITTSKCRAELRKHFKNLQADVVLHDGAPNVGTAWVHDAFGQVELTLMALKLAVEFLAPNGTFVTKVFRSGDYNSLLWVFNQLFRKVEATKPSASRNTSAEIFVVCQGYKAPKKIDPRLLDSKFVFKELDPQNAKRPDDIFSAKTGHKRHRTGYEEGDYTLFKKIAVKDFVEGDTDPINALATYNQIAWEDDAVSARYKLFRKETTPEVLACCEDLRVLGKSDFKRLLNWRLKLRARLREAAGVKDEDEKKPKAEEGSEASEAKDPEEEISEELDAKISQLDERRKKKERKAKEKLARYRQRVALQMEVRPDLNEDRIDDDPHLFQLTAAAPALHALNSDAAPDPTQLSDDDIDLSYGLTAREEADRESDEDSDAYAQRLDRYFEESYAAYKDAVAKRKPKEKIGKKKRGGDELEEAEEVLPTVDLPKPKLTDEDDEEADSASASRSERSDDEVSASGEAEPRPLTGKAARFFDQDLFHNISDLLDPDADAELGGSGEAKAAEAADSTSNGVATRKRRAGADEGFEVVPKEDVKSSDDEEEESDSTMDSEDEAQARALGKSLLRRKSRQDLIDASYNRRAWVDPEGVPSWFVDDEKRHNQANIPMTKAMADEIRMAQKEIDARPIKKVAEAKARKKMRTERNMEKLKKKAGTISNNPDLTEKAKQRALEKLYKQADKKQATNPRYMVARKGGAASAAKPKKGQKSNGKTRLVDPRQKKDKRAKLGVSSKGVKAKPKLAKGKRSRAAGRK